MWTSEFIRNTNVPSIGTLIARHTDGTVYQQDRIDVSDESAVDRFVAKAKKKQSDAQTEKQDRESRSVGVSAKLNS